MEKVSAEFNSDHIIYLQKKKKSRTNLVMHAPVVHKNSYTKIAKIEQSTKLLYISNMEL